MKKLMYILLILLMAANIAAQESYVIDLVCVGAGRYYRIDGEKGSTYEWYVKDTLGNEISKPPYSNFQIVNSPGDTIWGSEINITWSDVGVFYLSTLHYSSHGCDTLEQGWIEVYELPEADAGKDMIVCSNEPAVLSTDTAWHFSSLIWTSTGDGIFNDETQHHPTYLPGKADSISGSVTLILTANGRVKSSVCEPAVDSMVIRYSNPSVTLSFADLLCYNDSSGWIKAEVSGGFEPYIYSWTGPGTYVSGSNSIFGLAAGKYILTVTDSIGCLITDSVEIMQPFQLLASIATDTTEICDDGIISLNGIAAGGTGSYTHLWTGSGSAFLSSADNISPYFTGAPAGFYTLFYTLTDENGCVAADTIDLTVLPKDTISLDTVICGNEVPFAWFGKDYFTSGIYVDTIISAVRCDTILILDLTVIPIDTITFDTVICIKEAPFAWYGKNYFTSGIYTDTLVPATGCQSILILDLTVTPIDTITLDAVICGTDAPFTWYGKDYFTTSVYTDSLPALIGCDTILILNLTVLPIDTIALDTTICGLEAPFAWNGTNYYTSGIYTKIFSPSAGCDTVLLLNLTVLPIDTITFDTVICGLEAPLSWFGNDYFVTGTYIDTLIAATGCDSIAILNLTVLPIDTLTFDTIICISEAPFAWYGKDYNTSGVYLDTLISSTGCDSILILDLTVLPIDTISFETVICISEAPFNWYGKDYITSGIYTDTIPASIGCDTILILDLTVLPIDTVTFDTIICGMEVPYAWNGKDYFVTGIYTDTLPALVGCDTILILDLTVLPIDTITFDTVICGLEAPLSWLGNDYFVTGTYIDTLIAATGCDSIAILNLTVLPVDTLVTDTVICGNEAPFAWNGTDYFVSGTFVDTLASATGCESILVLNLTVLPIDTMKFDTIICISETPFVWYGKDYFTTGIFTDTLSPLMGCDTILILDLTVMPIDTVSVDTVICISDTPFAWYGKNYFNTGIYTDTLPATVGCDTILILDLTVLPIDTITFDTVICGLEAPLSWFGNDYFVTGTYIDTLIAATGCDSIAILNLTVLPVDTLVTDTVICGNEAPFAWNGTDYFVSGTFVDTLASATGCDSILVLNLTVLPIDTIMVDTIICISDAPFAWNGNSYFTSGFYSEISASLTGCDTILILDLTVLPIDTVSVDTVICISNTPFAWHGKNYFNTGIYTDTLPATVGCDTILILDLKVIPTDTITLNTAICANEMPFTWYGKDYFNTGIYTDTLSSVAGCQTILILDLTILKVDTVSMDTMLCAGSPSFVWNSQTVQTNSDGTYRETLVNSAGCDSILILNVKVLPVTTSLTDTTILASELPFVWNGNSYINSGTYNINSINANGCDSILTLILHVVYTVDVTDTIVCVQDLPVIWNGNEYYTSGDYLDTLISVSGTDSIVQLNIILIPETKPVFDQLGPYCLNEKADPLPLTSQNGITGKWSQTEINTSIYGSQLLTFMPDPGQCAAEYNMEINIDTALVVSVTIVADRIEVMEGETVTFTATPVNGGADPGYTWFVNGSEVSGETSVTFTYTPLNNDVVYAILTSSITGCTVNNPATSNKITIKVIGTLPVSVTIAANQTDICLGGSVTFTAEPVNGGASPVYAWFVNGSEIPGETSVTYTYTPENGDVVYAVLTSSLTDVTGNPATSNEIPVSVTNELAVSVSIISDKTEICDGETVIFTARPVNGGLNPVYAWYVNGIEIPGETSVSFAYRPQNSDLVHATLTSDLGCATNNPAISNKIPIKVNENATVSIFITANQVDICEDEPVTFTAITSNGGTNPVFAWFVNGKVVPGETSTSFTYIPNNLDGVYSVLTSDLTCTTGAQAFSNKITIFVAKTVPVSVSIAADKTEICEGEAVTYTASAVNDGSNPIYEWYVNGNGIPGVTGPDFIYQPQKGDEVFARLTSNLTCTTNNPAMSNKVRVIVNDMQPVAVSITADKSEICDGETVIFTAIPVNGGANPVYAWFVNGKEIAGETSVTFAHQPASGDEIYARLTSGNNCVIDPVAFSNKITITISGPVPVSVSIIAGKNIICESEMVTYTATPVNGGTNPVYTWFVNGKEIPGETKVTFTYSPEKGDSVYAMLTSDLGCVTGNQAISNKISVIVNDKLPVSVSIIADKTEICDGETVTFTATPVNGGANPVYAWFVNGILKPGETKVTFSYIPDDGDKVYVKLTSNEVCIISPEALSDTITITITGGLQVKVEIEADNTLICDGETVTFNAIPVNGGANPVYAWFVNGKEIAGEKGDSYAYKPKHDDKIYVKLNSGELCATDPVALSDTIAITVTNNLVVSATIPNQKLMCAGEPVTFTATTENGGSNPVYTWFVNNVKITGNNTATLTYTPNDKDEIFVTVESDVVCVKDKTGKSNVVIISVGDIIPPVAKCQDITIYLDAEGKASITTAQINNGSYDNCELDTLYLSKYNFGCADVGKNNVTLTAVDVVGLTDNCVATVTVLDTIKPVVICRGPFEIQLDENAEYKLTVAEVLQDASDACGFDTMYVFPHELNCDNIGLTTITLIVKDMNGNSSYCQTEVMVYGNRPPNVVVDSAITKENVPVIIDVAENDFDEKTSIDVSSLSISVKPLYGKVSINPVNGDLTYTPNRNFSGVDVLKYRIYDDGIPCEPEYGEAFVYIIVEPVNDKPLAVDDYYNASCFSVTRNVLDNDSDPDGTDNLQIVTNPLTPPNHGQLIIDSDGTISYFPNESYIGIDSFQYVIWDNGIPEPLSDTAWVYINVDCSEESQDPLDCELFIPEGFSPNEDGVHDFFRIMCIHNYPNAKMMIFNRNGDLLWQKENYGNYDVWGDQYNAWWWGTSVLSKYDVGRQTINGEPKLKVGNYIYVLQLGNGVIKNGTVMISY